MNPATITRNGARIKREPLRLFDNVRLTCLQNANNWLLAKIAIARGSGRGSPKPLQSILVRVRNYGGRIPLSSELRHRKTPSIKNVYSKDDSELLWRSSRSVVSKVLSKVFDNNFMEQKMEKITQEFPTLRWVSESVLVDATDEDETAESTKATFSSLPPSSEGRILPW